MRTGNQTVQHNANDIIKSTGLGSVEQALKAKSKQKIKMRRTAQPPFQACQVKGHHSYACIAWYPSSPDSLLFMLPCHTYGIQQRGEQYSLINTNPNPSRKQKSRELPTPLQACQVKGHHSYACIAWHPSNLGSLLVHAIHMEYN